MGPCFLFDSLIAGNSDSTVKVWVLQAIPILRDYVIMGKKRIVEIVILLF